ncbi:unnamed protein product [Closterium sp. Naga37s-1]|nr:unnamed protein product [Closterium sp. Naga37s-1]
MLEIQSHSCSQSDRICACNLISSVLAISSHPCSQSELCRACIPPSLVLAFGSSIMAFRYLPYANSAPSCARIMSPHPSTAERDIVVPPPILRRTLLSLPAYPSLICLSATSSCSPSPLLLFPFLFFSTPSSPSLPLPLLLCPFLSSSVPSSPPLSLPLLLFPFLSFSAPSSPYLPPLLLCAFLSFSAPSSPLFLPLLPCPFLSFSAPSSPAPPPPLLLCPLCPYSPTSLLSCPLGFYYVASTHPSCSGANCICQKCGRDVKTRQALLGHMTNPVCEATAAAQRTTRQSPEARGSKGARPTICSIIVFEW